MKSGGDGFAQKKFSKDIFYSEICYRYDFLVIGADVLTMQELIVFLVSFTSALCFVLVRF